MVGINAACQKWALMEGRGLGTENCDVLPFALA